MHLFLLTCSHILKKLGYDLSSALQKLLSNMFIEGKKCWIVPRIVLYVPKPTYKPVPAAADEWVTGEAGVPDHFMKRRRDRRLNLWIADCVHISLMHLAQQCYFLYKKKE